MPRELTQKFGVSHITIVNHQTPSTRTLRLQSTSRFMHCFVLPLLVLVVVVVEQSSIQPTQLIRNSTKALTHDFDSDRFAVIVFSRALDDIVRHAEVLTLVLVGHAVNPKGRVVPTFDLTPRGRYLKKNNKNRQSTNRT